MKRFNKILMKMQSDVNFMSAGRRNDDTVNLLITCRMLGLDPDEQLPKHFISNTDVSAYYDHKTRIEPYLDSWCGDIDDALGYMIWTSDYMKGVN